MAVAPQGFFLMICHQNCNAGSLTRHFLSFDRIMSGVPICQIGVK